MSSVPNGSMSQARSIRFSPFIAQHHHLFISFVVLIAIVFSTATIAHATSPSWTVQSLTATGCNSGNIGFTTVLSGVTSPTTLHFRTQVDAGGIRYMDEDAGTPGGNGNYGWHLYFSNSGGPATNAWPIPPDIPITVHFLLIAGPGGPTVTGTEITLSKCNGGTIIANATSGGPSSAVTFFSPGDNRVDPRPGDELAVFCNAADNPPNVVVYGIASNMPDSQKGFYLATFKYADLLKAGAAGLTRNMGNQTGSVSMMTDGKGDFYVAWNGGEHGATGQHDFSKSFACAFSQ